MARPPASVHWLRENAANRSPFRVLVFDTESRPIAPDQPNTHVLRLWAARLLRRKDDRPREPRCSEYQGHSADELAGLIDRLSGRDRTLWVMAHNLSFDLAVTALPVVLAERGWRLTDGALTAEAPWCRMANRDRHLTIADTWSWLPTSVERLGELVGIPKVALPDFDDSDAAWFARCVGDV